MVQSKPQKTLAESARGLAALILRAYKNNATITKKEEKGGRENE